FPRQDPVGGGSRGRSRLRLPVGVLQAGGGNGWSRRRDRERGAGDLEAVAAIAQEGRADGDLWGDERPQGRADASRAVVQGTGVDRLDYGQPCPVLPCLADGLLR